MHLFSLYILYSEDVGVINLQIDIGVKADSLLMYNTEVSTLTP